MGCCGGDVEEKDDAKVQVLMNSSPFGVCVDSEADLEELARSFARLQTRAGEELPESPFYIVSHGTQRARAQFLAAANKSRPPRRQPAAPPRRPTLYRRAGR